MVLRVLIYFSMLFSVLTETHLSSFKLYQDKLQKQQETALIELNNTQLQSYKDDYGYWLQISNKHSLQKMLTKHHITLKKLQSANLNIDVFNYRGKHWLFFPIKKTMQSSKSLPYMEIENSEFIWPLYNIKITSRVGSRWGKQHSGLDIAAPTGTLVLSAQTGKVKKIGYMGGYGLTIIIEHESGYETIYAHLSSIFVKKNDILQKGQSIGYTGNTGKSTGPHLHFELRCNNEILNPENFLIPQNTLNIQVNNK